MGLSPLFVDHVLELIQTVNRQGVTIFMVEQNAHLACRSPTTAISADRPHCIVRSGARSLHDPRIRDAYLGGQAA